MAANSGGSLRVAGVARCYTRKYFATPGKSIRYTQRKFATLETFFQKVHYTRNLFREELFGKLENLMDLYSKTSIIRTTIIQTFLNLNKILQFQFIPILA